MFKGNLFKSPTVISSSRHTIHRFKGNLLVYAVKLSAIALSELKINLSFELMSIMSTETASCQHICMQDIITGYSLCSFVLLTWRNSSSTEMWFEFSPHESGFLQHGAYVDTSLLNKNFNRGHVKPSNKKQVDMVQLQGFCYHTLTQDRC